MKEQFEKNQKIKVIVMSVASAIIMIIAISLYFIKGTNYNDKVTSNLAKKTTTTIKKDETNHVRSISISNAAYSSESKVKYYIPGLIIYEDKLYADLGSSKLVDDIRKQSIKINNADAYLLKEGITKAFIVEEGNKGYHYAFALNADGQLFYINHFKESKLKMLEVVEITEFKNIVDIKSTEGKEKNMVAAFAITSNGDEHNLSPIISKYAKLK